ncbi:MAG: TlpA disulfide reductase family protein [Candidatus Omnitrophota bacterium]
MQIFRKFRVWLFTGLIFLVLGFAKEALAGDIILNDLSGKAVNVSTFNGHPAILFFWTSWCPYCRTEIKALNQGYAQIKEEGIVVFGVNIGESPDKVRGFFKDYPLNFGILLDSKAKLAEKYGVLGVPTYVFLDKTGQVISQYHTLPENYKSLLFK